MTNLYNKLRRTTSSGKYYPEIDGLRFLAIFWIFLFHLNDYLTRFHTVDKDNILQNIFQNGYLGVELFFVISGLVLSIPFANHYINQGKKISLKKYYSRRFTRLEPPYFLVMILLFLFKINTGTSANVLFPHLLASLFYSHNIIYPDTLPLINSVAWSLEIEIQFYLITPLLAHIFMLPARLRRLILLFIIIAMPIVQFHFKIETLSSFQFIQYFLAGFFIGDIYVCFNKKEIKSSKKKLLEWGSFLLGLVVFASILIIPSSRQSLNYTLFITPAIILFYLIILFNPTWKKIFSTKWISVIGGMCYSIYLIHLTIIPLAGRFTLEIGKDLSYPIYFLIQACILCFTILLISTVFYYFIEKPCMQKDWHRKLFKKLNLVFR